MSKTDKTFDRGEIVIYQTSEKEIEIQVRLEKETVWLDAHQIARLFDVDRTVIVKHINNVYKSRELSEKLTCAKIAQVAADGKIRKMNLYNMDMIISGSLEEKAAHLLYLVIKDHPFVDGNKRIESLLFVYFLERNKYLYRQNGEKKINDNALTALALLIAESDPKDKDILIKIITNLLND